MFAPPPIPQWDGAHPIIVHFPIVLLAVAPLFVVLAMACKPASRWFAISALLVMLLGAGAVVLASNSGEAAEPYAEAVAGAHDTLERHEELAEQATVTFLVLAAVYFAIVAAQLWLGEKVKHPLVAAAHGVFLVPYVLGLLLLANVAHEGGRLVHEHGVRAPMSGVTPAEALPPRYVAPARAERRHEDD